MNKYDKEEKARHNRRQSLYRLLYGSEGYDASCLPEEKYDMIAELAEDIHIDFDRIAYLVEKSKEWDNE